jgi:Na+-translocating ferredoxin:NAD+ oxidoreductase RnfG subunit|tara:strand:+ start:2299 stop:2910 length:612 start_codon:yes stop_codon:yes gene_type:complete
MRKRILVHRIGLIVLAIFLLTVTVIWQRFWQRYAEEREQGILEAQLTTMLDRAVDFEKIALGGGDQIVKRSSPPSMRDAFRVLDSQGKTVGYVIRFRGQGYQNDIEGMLVTNASARKILRLSITESREWPHKNLFEQSSAFIRQFQNYDCKSPLRLMLPDDEGIHAITGASISSQIVVRFMNECIQALKIHLQSESKQARRTR